MIIFPGPEMPLRLECSSMVTSPSGNGVIILGGMSTEPSDDLACNKNLFEWKCNSELWTKLSHELNYPRRSSVAIPLHMDKNLPMKKIFKYFN